MFVYGNNLSGHDNIIGKIRGKAVEGSARGLEDRPSFLLLYSYFIITLFTFTLSPEARAAHERA